MGKYNTLKKYSQQMRLKNTPYGKARQVSKMMSKPTRTLYSAGKSGPEVHIYDLYTTDSLPNTTTQTVIDLTGAIAQGDGGANRNGQKISIKSVDIKGFVNVQAFVSAGIAGNVSCVSCDALLILDKQPNGSVPTAAQIFENSGTAHTPIAMEYVQRFEVLCREQYTISVPSTGQATDYGPNGGQLKFHKKMDLPTRYNDATGPATTNGLLLCFLSSNAAAATNTANVSIDSYVRLRFTDA